MHLQQARAFGIGRLFVVFTRLPRTSPFVGRAGFGVLGQATGAAGVYARLPSYRGTRASALCIGWLATFHQGQ